MEQDSKRRHIGPTASIVGVLIAAAALYFQVYPRTPSGSQVSTSSTTSPNVPGTVQILSPKPTDDIGTCVQLVVSADAASWGEVCRRCLGRPRRFPTPYGWPLTGAAGGNMAEAAVAWR